MRFGPRGGDALNTGRAQHTSAGQEAYHEINGASQGNDRREHAVPARLLHAHPRLRHRPLRGRIR